MHERILTGRLTNADPMPTRTPFPVDHFSTARRPHTCSESLLACPFDSAVPSWVMHYWRTSLTLSVPFCPHARTTAARQVPRGQVLHTRSPHALVLGPGGRATKNTNVSQALQESLPKEIVAAPVMRSAGHDTSPKTPARGTAAAAVDLRGCCPAIVCSRTHRLALGARN